MKLWLDDRRQAPAGWTRVFTVAEAQALLMTGQVEEASLDHDLGACDACMAGLSTTEWLETHDYDMPTCEHIGTGYTLCVWMADTGYWPAKMPVVHSLNLSGAERMRRLIEASFQVPRKAASRTTKPRSSGKAVRATTRTRRRSASS